MALIAKRDNTLRLQALDEAAEALGLEIGLPLATARARVPDLAVVEADPGSDQALLASIGEVCRRYSPTLSLDPPDGVHLDITGAARLFGGERKLIDDLAARIEGEGIGVRIGVARTLGLAWALCHYQDRRRVRSVRDLPVAALRLDPERVGVLNRLGLRKVGQILDIPRPVLARRLGESLLERLDETLGFRALSFDRVPEPIIFYVQHKLLEPICLEPQVLALCQWLAERLAKRLETRRIGGRRFILDLFRVDGARRRLVVQAGQPISAPARIAALFTERLATLDGELEADFGFDLLRLTAEDVEPMIHESRDFMGDTGHADFTALTDRLSARLGQNAVRHLVPVFESRIPEQAVRAIPLTAKAAPWADESAALYRQVVLRPITLFTPPQLIEVIAGVPEDPPRQFTWRRSSHAIVRAEGPERIAQEWWREPEPAAAPKPDQNCNPAPVESPKDGLVGTPLPAPDRSFRDYYRVEDDQGRRFWVFREGAFVAGPAPRWFLHGLLP